MASSIVSASAATFIHSSSTAPRPKFAPTKTSFSANIVCSGAGGLKMVPRIQFSKAATKPSHGFKSRISCSSAQAETLEIVQSTIAKQLSIDESTVKPQTKFADLGADSLDTVEIMMALEEKFGVSIGESGAENIATVQDAADLIEKVKAAA